MAQLVKNLPAMQETWVRSLGWEDPLKKGKAAHSSILACITGRCLRVQQGILSAAVQGVPCLFPQMRDLGVVEFAPMNKG